MTSKTTCQQAKNMLPICEIGKKPYLCNQNQKLMKTILLVVGRTVEQHFITAINDYVQRTKRYLQFEIEVIPELKIPKASVPTSKRKRRRTHSEGIATWRCCRIAG